MLLALGAAPLAGCGQAPAEIAPAAAQSDGPPALLDIRALAGATVRRIDGAQVVPARFGQPDKSSDSPNEPVVDFDDAEVVSAPAVTATAPGEPQAQQPLAELSRLPSDEMSAEQAVEANESSQVAEDEPAGDQVASEQVAVQTLPECASPQPDQFDRDATILPIEGTADEIVEQTELPWARAAVNNEALVPVLMQADTFARRAFELADRGASYSARAEFTGALRLVAQALDTQQQTSLYTRSLAAGITAIKEADDFSPQLQRGQIDLARTIAGHTTSLLKDQPLDGISPLVARQRYLNYAKEQLTAASGLLPNCSLAMFGMGQLAMQAAPRDPASQLAAMGRAMVWHQAALNADPHNFRSANELGVLLAKNGDAASARALFTQSLRVSPQPAVWANLAEVEQRLGNKHQAAIARQQAELASRSGQAAGLSATIRWVDPSTFARTGNADSLAAPAANVKDPQATAAAPKPPKKNTSSWNLWNGSWR
jgi:tetratricopeptide (TPR) repeat protein